MILMCFQLSQAQDTTAERLNAKANAASARAAAGSAEYEKNLAARRAEYAEREKIQAANSAKRSADREAAYEAKEKQREKNEAEAVAKQALEAESKALAAKQERSLEKQAIEQEIEKISSSEIVYDESKHGPKIKNMFVGMNYKQFVTAANELIKKTKPELNFENRVSKSIPAGSGYDIDFTEATKKNANVFDMADIGPEISAHLSTDGIIDQISFVKISVKAFKAEDVVLADFVQACANGYHVDFKVSLNKNSGKEIYTSHSAAGVVLDISQQQLNQIMPKYLILKLKKVVSDNDLKNAIN